MDEIIYIPLVDEHTSYEISQNNEYDNIEIPKTLLPSRLRKEKNLFGIEIKNDLSSNALLLPKDLVVLAKLKAPPRDGDFVAYYHNKQIKFRYFFKKKNGYELKSAHPSFASEKINVLDKVKIIGQVVLIIRNEISDLPTTDEEIISRYDNQFLVFHENIKGLIHRGQRTKILQAFVLLSIVIITVWFFLNVLYLNCRVGLGFNKKHYGIG